MPSVASVRLYWPGYRLFPYEQDFALRELRTVADSQVVDNNKLFVEIKSALRRESLGRMTYFAFAEDDGGRTETSQHMLEAYCSPSNGRARQSTRYSVHGLHEYKGKFNPQVAHFLINYLDIGNRGIILDPFCGSGTTLVEAMHSGVSSHGCDLNPLAVFLTNAKINALLTPAEDLHRMLDRIQSRYARSRDMVPDVTPDLRTAYLAKWFPAETLQTIEILRVVILAEAKAKADIFLCMLSNLLRDHSFQEPEDLRVRRRSTPLPSVSIPEQFFTVAASFLVQKARLDHLCPVPRTAWARAVCRDIREAYRDDFASMPAKGFDAAVTSPPYATALPYIDTQRLSIVWLGLRSPAGIAPLGANLIGSREFEGQEQRQWAARLAQNSGGLPKPAFEYCRELQTAVADADGFRRRAVPANLYRYLVGMLAMFDRVAHLLRPAGRFALIVGHNHTFLGGKRFDIDTPGHLVTLAKAKHWHLIETVPLQTYQRYGLHHRNAVGKEELILLERR